MIAIILTSCIALIVIGAARIYVFVLDYRDARIDADYRAFAMIANAKRQVRRG